MNEITKIYGLQFTFEISDNFRLKILNTLNIRIEITKPLENYLK